MALPTRENISTGFIEKLKQMIREDKFIQAIKEFRDNYNLSLKEAKDFIDNLKIEVLREETPEEERKIGDYNEMVEFAKAKLDEMGAAPTSKIMEEIIDVVWDSAYDLGQEEGYETGWIQSMRENNLSDRELQRQLEMAEQRGYKRGVMERSR